MRFVTVLIVSVLLSGQSLACSCLAPNDKTATDAFNKADVIVKAEVVAASEGFSERGPLLQLDIKEVIKGQDVPDFITANYNLNLPACGHRFEPEQRVTLALYDTRDVELRRDNARGYGFRVMISCYQDQVRYFLEQQNSQEIN